MNIVLASGIPTPWHGLFEYDAGRWPRVACAHGDALLQAPQHQHPNLTAVFVKL